MEMHLQGGSGAGLGIAALLSTGHCLAHWGGSSCCVWIENGFSLFSHLWSGKCMPPLFSEPSQTGKNDPSSSLVFLSYPSSPCLRLSCPPAKWCSTPVFYLRHSCVSKPQTSGAPEEQTHADPLEEGFPALWLVLACRRRQWLQHCASEFMVNRNTQLLPPGSVSVPRLVGGTVGRRPQGPLSARRL